MTNTPYYVPYLVIARSYGVLFFRMIRDYLLAEEIHTPEMLSSQHLTLTNTRKAESISGPDQASVG